MLEIQASHGNKTFLCVMVKDVVEKKRYFTIKR